MAKLKNYIFLAMKFNPPYAIIFIQITVVTLHFALLHKYFLRFFALLSLITHFVNEVLTGLKFLVVLRLKDKLGDQYGQTV